MTDQKRPAPPVFNSVAEHAKHVDEKLSWLFDRVETLEAKVQKLEDQLKASGNLPQSPIPGQQQQSGPLF